MHLFADAFIQHAFIAGVPIAVAAGLVGYFLVLRSQVFSGDALSHVAFTGALGALALGVDSRHRLVRLDHRSPERILALLGGRGRAADVVIGTMFAWVLGLGVLALSVYASGGAGGAGADGAGADGAAGVRVLFGSIFGLDRRHAVTAAAISAGVVLVLLGDRAAAALRQPRPAGRRRPRGAGARSRRRLPGRRRSHRGRCDPGDRRPAHRRAAGRAGRSGPAPDRPPVRRDGLVHRPGRAVDDRRDPGQRRTAPRAAELRDPGRRVPGLPRELPRPLREGRPPTAEGPGPHGDRTLPRCQY